MANEQTTYNRNTLYEQVSQRPVREVAKQYGVSDVALSKICRRLRVPRPWVGYWTRKGAGYEDPIPPLPDLKPGEPTEYTVERSTLRPRAAAGSDEASAPAIVVAETLSNPHPLVQQTRSVLRKETQKSSVLTAVPAGCLDIQTTSVTLTRALLVADALLKALNDRGFEVESTRPRTETDRWSSARRTIPSETRVLIDDGCVEFGITEGYDSIVVERPPQRWGNNHVYTPPPTRDRRANGTLALHIKNAPYGCGLRTLWRDGKVQRLERCLSAVIQGMRDVAAGLRAQRLERERWQREREEAERRRIEEEERQRREQALVEDLNRRIERWHEARLIREFVSFLEADAQERDADTSPESELGSWIAWARARADRLARTALHHSNDQSQLTKYNIPSPPPNPTGDLPTEVA